MRPPPHALLYVMVKPPLAPRDACVACRKALGINPHYAANRLHCTMLPLGRWDAWPVERLAPLIAALGGFAFDPFFAVFDRVAYSPKGHATLKPRRGLRAPARFHAALRDHLAAVGIAPAVRPAGKDKDKAGKQARFQMHLTLAYRGPHPGAHSESGQRRVVVGIDATLGAELVAVGDDVLVARVGDQRGVEPRCDIPGLVGVE